MKHLKTHNPKHNGSFAVRLMRFVMWIFGVTVKKRSYQVKIRDELDKHSLQWHDAVRPSVEKYGRQADKEVRELKETANAMLQELIECSYELQCLCGHPACKSCQRYGQLAEFIDEMKKVV